jgi:DeoR/GlpR family transcriptional regulator of sugar metabolism
MLTEERRRVIVDLVRSEGKVLAAELSDRFEVSQDTIRRDLRELSEAGVLQRVHGGALPRSPTDPRYAIRKRESPAAKSAIAVAAVRLVRPGQVVILDSGTTVLEVAEHLPSDLRATIVTNSPPAAIALGSHPHLEVFLVGGGLVKESLAVVGAEAVEALHRVRADLCILGVAGLHPEVGISMLNLEEVFVKRAMIEGAAEVAAVAAGDKFGTAAPYVVGPLSMLTHVVTEQGVPEITLGPYRAVGLTVVQG